MKLILYIKFSLLFFPIILLGCKENVNNVVKPGDKPVINSYLAPGQAVEMQVYTEIPYTDTDSAYSKPIVGLKIQITQSNGKNFQLIGDKDGNYLSKKNELVGPVGTTVTMSFSYNGRTVSSNTIIPPKPLGFKIDQKEIIRVARSFGAGAPGSGGGPGGAGFVQEPRVTINLNWQNNDNVYHFVASQNMEVNPIPIIVLPANFNFPRRRFNNQPTLSDASSIQSQTFEYFGKHAIILYRLNPDYAALYINNSSTSQNISTPQGTISNGLGIFTGVNTDTLFLNVKKYQ